jgi:hypothetical protein
VPAHEIRAYPESDDLRHQTNHLPEDVDQYYSDARRVLEVARPSS